MTALSQATKDKAAAAIYNAQLLKFGEFTLKSGVVSPFYLDFRKAQSHPSAFHAIIAAYGEMIQESDESLFLAGVPEAATPLAAATGFYLERALLQPRKVIKDHGTKSSVEGDFQPSDHVILIDDLITKGDSKLEAIKQIEEAGLVVEKFVVLVDREQGGMELIKNAGYTIEAAFTITELIEALLRQGSISQLQYDTVTSFIKEN